MQISRQKPWFYILLLAGISLSFLWDYLPRANSVHRLSQLQKNASLIGAENIPLSPDEILELKGAEAVKLALKFEGRVWTLIAVDGSGNRKFIHDPQYCFQGTGWECVEQQKLPLPNGKAEILKFTRDGESKIFAYWFDDDRRTFYSMPEFLFRATLRRITLGLSGKEPIFMNLYPGGDFPTSEEWKSAATKLIPKITK